MRTATLLLLLVSFVQAPTAYGNEHESAAVLGAATGDAIVVVSDDIEITECIEYALRDLIEQAELSLRVVPFGEIRNAFFPWLELKTNNNSTWMITVTNADEITKKLIALTTNRVARPAFEKTGLQYVIQAEIYSSIDEEYVGFGGGGYSLGAILGDKETTILAKIWDMSNPQDPMNHEASEQRGFVMPVFIIPFPPTRPDTEQAACITVSENIIERISGKRLRLERPLKEPHRE